jgi:uncharacterized protein DUF4154
VGAGMRPRLKLTLLALACVLGSSPAGAEEPSVPVGLEAELLAKVAAYDKHMPARAGDRVHVVILAKHGNPDSERASAQMASAIAAIAQIGGRPHDELLLQYAGAKALAEVCRTRHAAIVFIGPGFSEDIGAIGAALDGVDVLSASAIADYVPKGVVLGFDLVSGKPKLLVNLTQAKKQKVDLASEVLKLMKVFE